MIESSLCLSYEFYTIIHVYVFPCSFIGVLPIERPAGIEENEFLKPGSLVYHYGHNNPAANLKLYETLVSKTYEMYRERCKENPASEEIVRLVSAK